MIEKLSYAEQRAVEDHRAVLCSRRGCNVSLEEAASDWLATCAVGWREARQREILAAQRLEIERHKWIESEKAGHDLGRDAVLDWIKNNAASWRNWYEAREEAAR
ncbi:MAG TPA: hypothetical protein PLJ47_14620 [Candidatus Hydrogenedentes bacterium]|nr:hypothetical protein [Candidatus Hydrogenedentota bacterium]